MRTWNVAVHRRLDLGVVLPEAFASLVNQNKRSALQLAMLLPVYHWAKCLCPHSWYTGVYACATTGDITGS